MPRPPSHITLSVAMAALVLLAAAACGGGEGDADPGATFVDDSGRSVGVSAAPERVVTLAPNLTEIVFTAGAGHKLVGVGIPDDFPAAVDTVPRVSVHPLSVEGVAARDPDVVLATDQVNNPQDLAALSALGLPVAVFSFSSVADVVRTVRRVGTLLDTRAAADAAADSLAASFERLRRRMAAVERRPLVLFLVGDQPLFAFGADSYIHEVIDAAGGRSATATMPVRAPVLSEEYVLTRAPDVIVGAWGEDYDPARLRALHPTWDVVPAVRDGRVYSLNPDFYLRPGPRLVEGAYRMAAVLHPSLFDAPSADATTP